MSYKQTNIKDWEKEDILEWITSIGLSDKWTEKITEIITQLECTGADLLSLKNGKELDESFALDNPMLSNRIFREFKKIKTILSSSNNSGETLPEFKVNICGLCAQAKTLVLNRTATRNTLISDIKQWYKQQSGVNTHVSDIILKSKIETLLDNKTLGFYGINNQHNLITVNFNATGGGYPQGIIDDWSEYSTMLTNIGFINIPPSPDQAHQTWIKMLICINKKTNNTPSKIRNREELIEMLKEDGFYMNETNWFQTNCPQIKDDMDNVNEDIQQENKEFQDIDMEDNDIPPPNVENTYENGLFGNVFLRTIYIASSICLVSMLSFGVWFSTPISDEFNAGYGLSAFATTILCLASVVTLICTFIKKTERTIPKEKWVNWSMISMYFIGGLFYFFGGCGIANAWNSVDASSIAGIFFAEQTFVGLHGMLAGLDLYEMKILNDKKWRIIIFNALFLFLALIAFFSFAVLSTTFNEAGLDNGAIAFLATFYFLVMIPPIFFLILYLMPSMQQMLTKPIVLYILTGSFVFCVVCILIGYFVLTAEFQRYFLGDRIGIFMLLTAILIASDMLFDHILNKPIAAQNYQGLSNQTR